MSKATLTFKLPEEQGEFNLARYGIDFYSALVEIGRVLRAHRKYDQHQTAEELHDAILEQIPHDKMEEIP